MNKMAFEDFELCSPIISIISQDLESQSINGDSTNSWTRNDLILHRLMFFFSHF